MESLTSPQIMNSVNQPRNISGCICSNCKTTQTPLWRRGDNDELLCNACGLYYRAKGKHRRIDTKPRKTSISAKKNLPRENPCSGTCPGNGHCNGTGGNDSCQGCPALNQRNRPNYICFNCSATTTPLWRRDLEGNPICNACGLYSKMHGKPRPVSARRNTIKRRVRLQDSTPYLEHNYSPLRDNSEESDISSCYFSPKRLKSSPKLHPKVGTTVKRKEVVTIYSRPPNSAHSSPSWLDLVNDALIKSTSSSSSLNYSSDDSSKIKNCHRSFSIPTPLQDGAQLSPASCSPSQFHLNSDDSFYSRSSPLTMDSSSRSCVINATPDVLSFDVNTIQKEILRIDELRYRYTQMLNYLDYRIN